MQISRTCRLWRVIFIIPLVSVCPTIFAASNNSWTNPASGLWSVASNWSSNRPPDSTFSVITISNANSKAVTIDATTAAANLSIQKLTLSAPTGTTNMLQLLDLTTNNPLRLSSTLMVDRQSILVVSNSGVVINGFSGGILDCRQGSVVVNQGLLDCSTTTSLKVGSTAPGPGQLIVNEGTVAAAQLQVASGSGSQGLLTLSNSLLTASSLVSIGDGLNSTGAVVLEGGKFDATNDMTRVGNLGTGQMNISNGTARMAFLSVGDNFGGTGTVSVTGGELQILPRTDLDYFRIGNSGFGRFNLGGGVALVGSELHLGDNVDPFSGLMGTGVVSVTAGTLIATNYISAIGRYAVGWMTLSGGVTLLTNTSVGRHDGAIGTLLVQSNAVLTLIGDLSIGRFSNSVGHAEIDGGSVSLPGDSIWVGREGTGDLTIAGGTIQARSLYVGASDDTTNTPSGSLLLSGGTTLLSSSFIVGTSQLSTGQVVVAGGVLAVTNSTGTGTLNVQNGGMSINAGNVTADALLLTNSSGQLTFTSGMLGLKSAVVANGQPFVVGDGTNPATLDLLGGTLSFADGLVISSNASLTGCGTIVGNIVNNGTIATNCGSGVRITGIYKNGSTTEITFTTLNGANHLLQYNPGLQPADWVSIPPAVVGNGTVMTNFDSTATAPARFYRIQVQ